MPSWNHETNLGKESYHIEDGKDLVLDEALEKEPSLELPNLQTRCLVMQDHKFLIAQATFVWVVCYPQLQVSFLGSFILFPKTQFYYIPH